MTLAIWFVSFFLSVAPPTPPSPYTGFWLLENKDAVIEISQQGNFYVGRYVAFRVDPANAKKKAQLNTYMLKDLKPDGNELNGKIIDPSSGKDYKATLSMAGAQTITLKVKAMGITAHTETLTRQPAGK